MQTALFIYIGRGMQVSTDFFEEAGRRREAPGTRRFYPMKRPAGIQPSETLVTTTPTATMAAAEITGI